MSSRYRCSLLMPSLHIPLRATQLQLFCAGIFPCGHTVFRIAALNTLFFDRSSSLSEITMLQVAAEMNLSETAFVTTQELNVNFTAVDRFHLRWFTPTNEVPLCGHATLATAKAIYGLGNSFPALTFSTLSGDLIVQRDNGNMW